jgi:hypothetical protein
MAENSSFKCSLECAPRDSTPKPAESKDGIMPTRTFEKNSSSGDTCLNLGTEKYRFFPSARARIAHEG